MPTPKNNPDLNFSRRIYIGATVSGDRVNIVHEDRPDVRGWFVHVGNSYLYAGTDIGFATAVAIAWVRGVAHRFSIQPIVVERGVPRDADPVESQPKVAADAEARADADARAAGAEAAAPPPATSSAKRQHGHHLAALNAAGWALRSFASSPHDGLGHRAAAAMGLSDGLSDLPCWPAHKNAVEIEAYRMGHRAGLVVRTGSATS